LNYLIQGAEVSLIVAIDLTNSNKSIDDPESLHYSDGKTESKYYQALENLVGIM
jgi:hypothetical protein